MIGIVMGSQSDLATMRHCGETLEALEVPYEIRILSAHRTPAAAADYAAAARGRGLQVIIAAAGGAAHLAGVLAAKTTLPVLGVPMQTASLGGFDSLCSIVQMPSGIPVGTLAIGRAGAVNAALLAVSILSLANPAIAERLAAHREKLKSSALEDDQRLSATLAARDPSVPLGRALQAAGFKID